MIKKMLHMLTSVLTAFTFVIAVSSCATNSVSPEVVESPAVENKYLDEDIATLTKHDDAMFWEVNGTDSNGEASKLYVLGTIHVGDDRLYPLPEAVEEAFNNSDIIVSELSSEDWGNILTETMNRQLLSAQVEAQRAAETGKPLISYLTEEEINCLVGIFGNIDMVNALTVFEPWVLITALSGLSIQQSGLNPEKGIDSYLIQKCSQQGRTVEGLDPLKTQMDVLSFGDWETQLVMLKDLLQELIAEPLSPGKELNELYESYLTYDEDTLNKIMIAEQADEEALYTEEYNDALFQNRNEAWAEKFNQYLLNGGETFIFAGSGHFVGEDSVFNIMKKNNTLR